MTTNKTYQQTLTEAISRTKQLISEPGNGLYAKVLKHDIEILLRALSGHKTLKGLGTELAQIWNEIYKLSNETILQVKALDIENATFPSKGSVNAIGWDLFASRSLGSTLQILPHQRQIIPTAIAIAVPETCYARIAPRSGLAAKLGVDVLAGVIDSDYRGEVKIILHNTTDNTIIVDLTKPIAQLILERAEIGRMAIVEELDDTLRGSGGFGSSDSN